VSDDRALARDEAPRANPHPLPSKAASCTRASASRTREPTICTREPTHRAIATNPHHWRTNPSHFASATHPPQDPASRTRESRAPPSKATFRTHEPASSTLKPASRPREPEPWTTGPPSPLREPRSTSVNARNPAPARSRCRGESGKGVAVDTGATGQADEPTMTAKIEAIREAARACPPGRVAASVPPRVFGPPLRSHVVTFGRSAEELLAAKV
jgi:hypothetical protein